jgi:hypothetical protein
MSEVGDIRENIGASLALPPKLYADPMMDTAFKIMMGDMRTAESLINSVLKEKGIPEVRIISTGQVHVPLRGRDHDVIMGPQRAMWGRGMNSSSSFLG